MAWQPQRNAVKRCGAVRTSFPTPSLPSPPVCPSSSFDQRLAQTQPDLERPPLVRPVPSARSHRHFPALPPCRSSTTDAHCFCCKDRNAIQGKPGSFYLWYLSLRLLRCTCSVQELPVGGAILGTRRVAKVWQPKVPFGGQLSVCCSCKVPRSPYSSRVANSLCLTCLTGSPFLDFAPPPTPPPPVFPSASCWTPSPERSRLTFSSSTDPSLPYQAAASHRASDCTSACACQGSSLARYFTTILAQRWQLPRLASPRLASTRPAPLRCTASHFPSPHYQCAPAIAGPPQRAITSNCGERTDGPSWAVGAR